MMAAGMCYVELILCRALWLCLAGSGAASVIAAAGAMLVPI
jgi:hypothetical protein